MSAPATRRLGLCFLVVIGWVVAALLSYWFRVALHGEKAWFWIQLYCPLAFGLLFGGYAWRRAYWWVYLLLGLCASVPVMIGTLLLVDVYTPRIWSDVLPAVVLRITLGGSILFTAGALLASYFSAILGGTRTVLGDKETRNVVIGGVVGLITAVAQWLLGTGSS